jgi:glycine/D-amino acid oxidase-like deaminating enzyme
MRKKIIALEMTELAKEVLAGEREAIVKQLKKLWHGPMLNPEHPDAHWYNPDGYDQTGDMVTKKKWKTGPEGGRYWEDEKGRKHYSTDDEWLTREQVAEICPSCADKMAAKGMCRIKASVIEAARWESMPKGWTDASRKKFWDSLTGDVKHKVTKCIKEMKGKVGDPGAFCASLADRVDPGWRSRD